MEESHFLKLTLQEATALNVSLLQENGFLGTHNSLTIRHRAFECDFTINISQGGIRTLEVKSNIPTRAQNLWTVLHDIIRFCMLFEGKFLCLESATFYLNDEKTIWSDELIKEYRRRTLSLYKSSDFTRSHSCFFISSLDVLSDDVLNRWIVIESELDISHQMVLYSMADTGLPIECKCATLIEACKPLVQLISKKVNSFKPQDEKVLRKCLEDVICNYGQDIFVEEQRNDFNKILSVFVESRNRIAHIKSNQGRITLNGAESVLYSVKFSMLYRHVLIDLLGIDYSLYQDKLKTNLNLWNQHKGILSGFIANKGR